jgi:hypothetical protein
MLVLTLLACSGSTVMMTGGGIEVTLGELQTVVPSTTLPASVVPQVSNNNLDVIEHTDGRLYFAFRTGPSHFASDEVEMHVLSSEDGGQSWAPELTLDMDTDLREPRFLSHGDQLVLHYAVLGTNPVDFEPQGTMRAIKDDTGWSPAEWIFEDGFIPWRTRLIDGIPSMIGYNGGADIYDQDEDALPQLEVKWLESEDGLSWSGETVWVGGGSETDFTFTEDNLIAVMRNEAGDEEGFGSKICRAERDTPTDWSCIHDCRKFDSPLMFSHGGYAWLIARRNVTEDGCFDRGLDPSDHSHNDRFLSYTGHYWQTPKRCTLWHVDAETLEVSAVLDLPSAGDTCFPSILGEDGDFEVWNYTSDPDLPNTGWLEGQQGPTMITRQRLTFWP